MSEGLSAQLVRGAVYSRSVGGSVEQFLRGLARCEIWGSKAVDGTVAVPPNEFDPTTGEVATELVRVGSSGVVRSWTWVQNPRSMHPLGSPFAFALIQLDGSDSALLHVIDVPAENLLALGMRVRAEWRPRRSGSILDIRAFVPERNILNTWPHAVSHGDVDALPLEVLSDLRAAYRYEPGLALTRFFRRLGGREITGGQCPRCNGVYVPPQACCSVCGVGPLKIIGVSHRGTVTSYVVVHVRVPSLGLEPPYACAWIRLDGSDVPFAHLLGEVELSDLAVGLRVEAVWALDEALTPGWDSVRYFRPAP